MDPYAAVGHLISAFQTKRIIRILLLFGASMFPLETENNATSYEKPYLVEIFLGWSKIGYYQFRTTILWTL